jgi:hypothetical protein
MPNFQPLKKLLKLANKIPENIIFYKKIILEMNRNALWVNFSENWKEYFFIIHLPSKFPALLSDPF